MRVERQQGRAYQGDLFDEALLKALRPGATGDGGTGTDASEERAERSRCWSSNEP